MTKLRYVLVILLLLSLLTVPGCGRDRQDTNIETTDSESSEENLLLIGVTGNCAPYNWLQVDDSNNGVKLANSSLYINGYEISLMQNLCSTLGMTPRFLLIRENQLAQKLSDGEIDCAVSRLYIPEQATASEGQQLAYSDPIFNDQPTAIAIKGKSPAAVTRLSALEGVTCNALFNSVWYKEALEQIPMADIITAADSDEELVSDLISGKCDLIVTSYTTARLDALNHSELSLLNLNSEDSFSIGSEYCSVGIMTTDANAYNLLEQLNSAIASQTSGTMTKLMEQSISNWLAYNQSQAAAAENK